MPLHVESNTGVFSVSNTFHCMVTWWVNVGRLWWDQCQFSLFLPTPYPTDPWNLWTCPPWKEVLGDDCSPWKAYSYLPTLPCSSSIKAGCTQMPGALQVQCRRDTVPLKMGKSTCLLLYRQQGQIRDLRQKVHVFYKVKRMEIFIFRLDLFLLLLWKCWASCSALVVLSQPFWL